MRTLPTAYLAPISWYRALLKGSAQIEVWESFPKQTLRNRCRIAGPNGVQTLSVPVCKCEHKQYTRDVQINYAEDWPHRHWQALVSAYGNTPFFAYYRDFLQPLYEKRFRYLIDLNTSLHHTICTLLYNLAPVPTVPYTTEWQQADLDSAFLSDTERHYYQIFADRQGFQENLSVVDLLFNMGNEALLYLTENQ